MLLTFHALVHGESPQAPTALAMRFDDALQALSALPRMFIEPDGAFVWRGTDEDGHIWQVDGNLVDRGDVLAHVELHGCCPDERLNELLRTLGWPEQKVAFQLLRRGVLLEEAAFRRQAASEEGAT